MRKPIIAAILAIAGWNITAHAATVTVVDDKFNDGSIANGANAGETDIGWYGYDNSAVPTVNTSSLPLGAGNGNVLSFAPTANNRSLHGYFPGLTLAEAGDFIQLSLTYKYDGPAINQGVRFGLVNSNGSIATTGTTAGTLDGDTGYGFSLNPGANATNNEIFDYDMVGVNAGYTRVGTTAFSTTDPGDAIHTVTFTITRNAADGLDITAAMSDVFATVNRTAAVATVPNYYFDQIYFRLSGAGNQGPVYLDNVLVTTNVPEPAAFFAAAMFIGVAVLKRGRKLK